MPKLESTNIFSEISTFFREKDDDKAIRTIMDVAKYLKLSSKTLDLESRWNCKYTRLQVFELLLLFPFFMVKNAYRYTDSTLAKVVPRKKDVFYRFMENGSLDWRMILYRINWQLLGKILLRDDSLMSKELVCLIIDDTDLPKTGAKIEKVGRIFSHVTHASLLGFKKSAFWRVVKKISVRFYPEDWFTNVAWSNLCKIAPFSQGNPSDKLYYEQLESCQQILSK